MTDLWFHAVSWALLSICSLITVFSLAFGKKFVIALSKNVDSQLFKWVGIITMIMLVLNCLSVLVNFVVMVYTDFRANTQLLGLYVSIPWRMFYTLSLLSVLLIFVLRLHVVFQDSTYAYSSKLFKFLFTTVGIGAICAILSIFLEVALMIDAVISSILGIFAALIYLFVSITTIALFINRLFKVCIILVLLYNILKISNPNICV